MGASPSASGFPRGSEGMEPSSGRDSLLQVVPSKAPYGGAHTEKYNILGWFFGGFCFPWARGFEVEPAS